MTRTLLAATLSAALLGTGCYSFNRESSRTSPSTTAAQALGGLWATSESLPAPGSSSSSQMCTNFTWRVSEFAGSSGSGTFSATCRGVLTLVGSAQGLVSGSSINWSAAATATGPNVPNACSVSLAATAQLTDSQIRIPYSGTTCLGPVAGTEVLGKQ